MTKQIFNAQEQQFMQLAINLAWQGQFSTSPNPRVGCVITQGQQIVGQGFHVKAGEPHAEIHALTQAKELAKGATAYITLEPCAHHGRTPPCAEALIQAGIKQAIIAIPDPNPLVAGKGIQKLQQAGISVQTGLLADQARTLNRGFLSRIERQRPFVSLKIATSLDGKSALSNGASKWITSPEARHDVQRLRAKSCGILTGIGTILADDPQLNVRQFPTLRQPIRIILDSQLKTPSTAKIIQDQQATWIFTHQANHQHWQRYPNIRLFQVGANQTGQLSLPTIMQILAQEGIGELLVEAGANLSTALLKQQLVDEIVLYQSPKLLGGNGNTLLKLAENPQSLIETPEWQTSELTTIGTDIKWVLQYQPQKSLPTK